MCLYVWCPKRKWNKIRRFFFRVLFLYSADSVRMDSVWFMCIEHKRETPWASRMYSQKEEWKRNERPTIRFQVHCTHSSVEWKRQNSTKSIVASFTFCGFDAQYDANDNHTHTHKWWNENTKTTISSYGYSYSAFPCAVFVFLLHFFYFQILFIYAMYGMNMQMPLKKCVGFFWWKNIHMCVWVTLKPRVSRHWHWLMGCGIRDSMISTHGQQDWLKFGKASTKLIRCILFLFYFGILLASI